MMMSANVLETKGHAFEDRDLEELLDVVDERTKIQDMLHYHIGDGFMSLARERYREPSSAERLGRLVYDDRDEVRSNVHVSVKMEDHGHGITMMRDFEEDGLGTTDENVALRRRKGTGEVCESVKLEDRQTKHADVRNNFLPIPSREVRKAIRSFRMAVDQAIELVNTNNKVQAVISTRSET